MVLPSLNHLHLMRVSFIVSCVLPLISTFLKARIWLATSTTILNEYCIYKRLKQCEFKYRLKILSNIQYLLY